MDGTLLDHHTYSKDEALPALNLLDDLGIPLVIVSSKTRSEIEPMLDLPCLAKIFVTENGSAIYLSSGLGLDLGDNVHERDGYSCIVMGMTYDKILSHIIDVKADTGVMVRGFSDMTAQEVSSLTGLDIASSRKAMQREFSEPFIFDGEPAELNRFIQALEERGLQCVQGGRFRHVLGRCDKGMAADIVIGIFNKNYPDIQWETIALGDSPNDSALLNAVDLPIIILRHDNTYMDYAPEQKQDIIRTPFAGPKGWNWAIQKILREDSSNG